MATSKLHQLNTKKMSDSISVDFDKLTKVNYHTWRVHAEALLVDSDLWDYVFKNKGIISNDAEKRELWIKQDKKAKSKLILHISSELLPLVEDCKTSREVWSKLANIYGIKGAKHEDSIGNSDADDEDEIINDIEISVDDFFETINDLSEKKIIEDKKLLSTTFTDNLFAQLKINGIKKLPDKTTIVDTVSDFIDDIGKLSKIEIKERKIELSNELIDNLLVKFDIIPHKIEYDETGSKTDAAEIQDKVTAGGGKGENDQVSRIQTSVRAYDDFHSDLPPPPPLFYNNERIPCESYDQGGLGNLPFINLHTPPSTPTLKTPRKCGVCRKEGHNRTTCPLNKPVTSASKYNSATAEIPKRSSSRSTTTNVETPARSYRCGLCREEGHNRTTCPLNKPAAAAVPKLTTVATESPKRSYKCGTCGEEGHNRTSCPKNKPAATVTPKYMIGTYHETPKKTYKCGICNEEGHNRTSCPRNKPEAIFTPKYMYPSKCGGCGKEGHNIRSCPSMNSAISSPKPAAVRTPTRSYTCGLCGEEGHNRTTCSRNYVTPAAPAAPAAPSRSAYKCGNCGGEGHNSRTCGRRQTSSLFQTSSYFAEPSYSYSSPASSYGGGGGGGGRRSYTCGNCGGSGHNSRTCRG